MTFLRPEGTEVRVKSIMLKSGETGTHTCTHEQTQTNAAAKICLPAVETAGAVNR